MKQSIVESSATRASAPESQERESQTGPQAVQVLTPGQTCWRIEHAERASVLIDAAAYFAALRKAMAKARSHIFIAGWDVDSRTTMAPGRKAPDGLPIKLLPFLVALLKRNPELHIYVLSWDFSVIYTLEREWMPSWVFSHAHPRLHFQLDSAHASGASQHQKLVVIDDALGFTGGIDLTVRRWDRPDHQLGDPERRDPEGEPYDPMHDAQMCVDGAAAAALGEMAWQRWQRASAEGTGSSAATSGERARPAADGGEDLWPERVPADFTDLPIGIARTFTGPDDHAQDVHEIAALTTRIIESARRYIYVENQYFTSSIAARALAHSLEQPEGPEIILILPMLETGWLEQNSMGVLRKQVLASIHRSDRHGRLHIYYPTIPNAKHGLHIHCKLLICDDRILKVGSANLSNRSLGLDTECDLIVEARVDDPAFERISRGVRHTLERLLAEHLGLHESAVRARLGASDSIVQMIEGARGRPRCLEPVPPDQSDAGVDLVDVLGDSIVDPERPMATETFLAGAFPIQVRLPWVRGIAAGIALVVPVLVMAMVYESHAAWFDHLTDKRTTLAWLWVGYVVACSTFVPLSLLLGVICAVLDAPWAFGFALSGAWLSASLSHGFGRLWRPLTLRFVGNERARQLQHSARTRAFRATVIARLLPVGNFTASNLLAGALKVPFARFCLGNLAGLSCGIAVLLLFTKRASIAIHETSAANVALCFAAGIAMILLCFVVARAFAQPATVNGGAAEDQRGAHGRLLRKAARAVLGRPHREP